MRSRLMVLAVMAASFGAAGFAQDQAEPSLGHQNTGRAAPFFYHQLTGGCEFLRHAFGRNGAWGTWRMRLSQVSAGEVSVAGEHALVSFDCLDGSACIDKGHLSLVNSAVARHEIPFESMAGAEAFVARLTDLRASCAAG